LLFNEGYKASTGDRLVREDLCHEAIRLTTLLTEHPATQEPRVFALLALMLFNAARLRARTDDAGNLLRLHEQNRDAWDQSMIQRGILCLGTPHKATLSVSITSKPASPPVTAPRPMTPARTGRASSRSTINSSRSSHRPSPP
jgi:predicted RNA polymerase sigma factor